MVIPKRILSYRHASNLYWMLTLVVVAIILLTFERFLLWKIQEENLFLATPLFWKQQMAVSGGALSWAGAWFTQLLFYPWIGVGILCGWWWLLMWLLRKTFNVQERWAVLLLIPVALLLVADMDMGYWIYIIKHPGWFFSPTLGMTATVALLWGFRSVSSHQIVGILFIIITTMIGYPLIGTYALAATILMGLWSWRLGYGKGRVLLNTIVALLFTIGIPLLYYRLLYCQTNLANIYWTGMPIFKILENYPAYYIPYGLLAICLLTLVITYKAQHNEQPQHKRETMIRRSLIGVLLGGTAIGVWWGWMKDENFHHEVTMLYYVEQTRWGKVLEEAAKQKDTPTRSIVLMRNLALSRLGRQGDEMYQYKGGSKQPAAPFSIRSAAISGYLLYYNYGMLNDCHHLCMESGVEYGWRVFHLKYMARCALLKQEVKVMHKFTGLLKQTLYYDRWAMQLENLQQHPKRLAEASETAPILHMLNYPDYAAADYGYAEKYLMGILAQLGSDDPYFQEQCLLATLWTKDSKQFWARFARYTQQHPKNRIPRYYQEAAWLFAHQDNPAALNLPYDEGVKRKYSLFMEQLKQYNGKDVEVVRQALYPLFGDTFYYDYYLMNDLSYL